MNTIPVPDASASTPSHSLSMFRIVGAVIAGLFTWIFVATILNLILRASWPQYHAAEIVFDFTLAMKFSRLILGAISSIAAGFVAALIGKRRIAATIVGITLLCLFIPDHYVIWHKFPVWYHLTFLVTLLPLVLLGAA